MWGLSPWKLRHQQRAHKRWECCRISEYTILLTYELVNSETGTFKVTGCKRRLIRNFHCCKSPVKKLCYITIRNPWSKFIIQVFGKLERINYMCSQFKILTREKFFLEEGFIVSTFGLIFKCFLHKIRCCNGFKQNSL